MQRDPTRANRIRKTIRIMRDKGFDLRGTGTDRTGTQMRLAEHFKVSRQRIGQLLDEVEREA